MNARRSISLFAPLLQNSHIKGQQSKFDQFSALQTVNACSLEIELFGIANAFNFY